jgi:hypothetical protein
MQARTLVLPPEKAAELERARDRDARAYLRERAGALRKIADGWSPRQVALHGLARPRQPKTVCRWLDAYERDGLAGLMQQPRGHRGFSPSAGRRAGRDGAPAARAARRRAVALAAG